MTLNLEQKKIIVAEVAEQAVNATSAIIADYRGLTVSEMNELRSKARQAGVYLRVVRNTLTRRALESTEFQCLQDKLNGPLVLLFSKEEPGASARLLYDFVKDHEALKVQAIALNGQLYSAKDLEMMAKLPSRNEALAMLMALMKAPVTQFVRTLSEPPAKLVRTLAAIRDVKQVA